MLIIKLNLHNNLLILLFNTPSRDRNIVHCLLLILLPAHEKSTGVCRLVHRPRVLRVLCQHVRLVGQHFEAYRSDDIHEIFVARLDTTLRLALTVMIQQRSQVHPHSTGLQDTGREESVRKYSYKNTSMKTHSLVNRLNEVNDVVRAVYKERGGHTVPIIGLRVHLQEVPSDHIHGSFWRIFNCADIGKFGFPGWITRSEIVH